MNMNVWWPRKNVVTSCIGATNLMMATNTMVLNTTIHFLAKNLVSLMQFGFVRTTAPLYRLCTHESSCSEQEDTFTNAETHKV